MTTSPERSTPRSRRPVIAELRPSPPSSRNMRSGSRRRAHHRRATAGRSPPRAPAGGRRVDPGAGDRLRPPRRARRRQRARRGPHRARRSRERRPRRRPPPDGAGNDAHAGAAGRNSHPAGLRIRFRKGFTEAAGYARAALALAESLADDRLIVEALEVMSHLAAIAGDTDAPAFAARASRSPRPTAIRCSSGLPGSRSRDLLRSPSRRRSGDLRADYEEWRDRDELVAAAAALAAGVG